MVRRPDHSTLAKTIEAIRVYLRLSADTLLLARP